MLFYILPYASICYIIHFGWPYANYAISPFGWVNSPHLLPIGSRWQLHETFQSLVKLREACRVCRREQYYPICRSFGGFHKWGYPGWCWMVYLCLFHGKSKSKMDENCGYPHLWKPSCMDHIERGWGSSNFKVSTGLWKISEGSSNIRINNYFWFKVFLYFLIFFVIFFLINIFYILYFYLKYIFILFLVNLLVILNILYKLRIYLFINKVLNIIYLINI